MKPGNRHHLMRCRTVLILADAYPRLADERGPRSYDYPGPFSERRVLLIMRRRSDSLCQSKFPTTYQQKKY